MKFSPSPKSDFLLSKKFSESKKALKSAWLKVTFSFSPPSSSSPSPSSPSSTGLTSSPSSSSHSPHSSSFSSSSYFPSSLPSGSPISQSLLQNRAMYNPLSSQNSNQTINQTFWSVIYSSGEFAFYERTIDEIAVYKIHLDTVTELLSDSSHSHYFNLLTLLTKNNDRISIQFEKQSDFLQWKSLISELSPCL